MRYAYVGGMITCSDIVAARLTLKKTQSEIASEAGVNLSTVWRWEKSGPPSRGTARKFIQGMIERAEAKRAESEAA